MTDKKISELTAATTPLAGTEVLPIVQSSSTKKVSVADLTAGRSISASGASISGNVSVGTATAIARLTVDAASGSPSTTNKGGFLVGTDTNVGVVIGAFSGAGGNFDGYIQAMEKRSGFATAYGLTLQPLGGNVTLTNGNVVIGTAGKGIDFSAAGNAAGMTSELLADYEEGTWTPTQGGGLTVVGTFSSSGTYTKIGRIVMISARVQGSTSIALTAGGVITNSIPFASGSSGIGNAVDSTATKFTNIIVYSGTFNVYAVSATTASPFVDFSMVYTV